MKITVFILAQTTGPVLFIIGLLLVAGIIGYLTAWFYAGSVYKPVIKGLEDDKVRLNREISELKDEINKLNKKVDDINEKANELEKKLIEKDNIIEDLRKKAAK